MKRMTAVVLAMTLLVTLSACDEQKGKTPEPSVERDLALLTSAECAGRLTGTPGNEKARDDIAAQFEAADLAFYSGGDSYLVPYTQMVFDPDGQDQTLTARFADGNTTTFQAGDDFYPLLSTVGGFSGEVTTDQEDPSIGNRVLLTDGFANADALGTVMYSDGATAHVDFGGNILKVRRDLYDRLVGAVSLSVDGTLTTREAEVHNVVGVWEGRERDDALLITAHFDHVGSAAGVTYAGAVDNASGVAALLETVRILSAHTEQRPPFDVVFVAFNGEDMGLKGSAAFVAAGLPYEQVNVINLDCIGLKGDDVLAVGDNGGALSDQFLRYLIDEKYPCIGESTGRSDHESFLTANIPAINLGARVDLASPLIHLPTDTADLLDPESIRRAAEVVTDYLLSEPELVSWGQAEGGNQNDEADRQYQKACARGKELVERLRPGRDEVIAFEMPDREFTLRYLVRDVSPFASPKELMAAYPDAYVPTALGEYRLNLMETPIYRSSNEPDDDRVQVSVRLFFDWDGTEKEAMDLPLETPAKLTVGGVVEKSMRESVFLLPYVNDQGTSLYLQVYDGERSTFNPSNYEDSPSNVLEREELEGGTLYKFSFLQEGEQVPSSVYYLPGDGKVWFSLYHFMREIDMDTLARLMKDAIPELERMTPFH